ncbi:MAG: hypothetical protein D6820_17845, partial [Lentisphaerae bacterium]
MTAWQRSPKNPLILAEQVELTGFNTNGPSIIKVPDWLPNALGRYYLYFAGHNAKNIAMAWSDSPEGPFTLFSRGVLHISQTPFRHHIASPDVH